jgi:hypothetical protein
MMTEVRQTFLLPLVLATACSREPEPAKQATAVAERERSDALDLYDVSLTADVVQPGQKISFCFKARNAVAVVGFPGKFSQNGALEGDCLVDTPKQDTLYRIQVTGSDGTSRAQTTYVKVRR